jgi:predicted signal transduction protein with EAL and GGDEF domain
MFTRGEALKTALIGAGIGVVVLVAIFTLAKHWYASPASPLVLLLSPGAFVGFFNPQSSVVYFAMALAVQAASYAIVALVIRVVFHRVRHRGKDAV